MPASTPTHAKVLGKARVAVFLLGRMGLAVPAPCVSHLCVKEQWKGKCLEQTPEIFCAGPPELQESQWGCGWAAVHHPVYWLIALPLEITVILAPASCFHVSQEVPPTTPRTGSCQCFKRSEGICTFTWAR